MMGTIIDFFTEFTIIFADNNIRCRVGKFFSCTPLKKNKEDSYKTTYTEWAICLYNIKDKNVLPMQGLAENKRLVPSFKRASNALAYCSTIFLEVFIRSLPVPIVHGSLPFSLFLIKGQ